MCGGTRRRSRTVTARRIMPPWKPDAGKGDVPERAPADRCRARSRCSSGSRAARRRATRRRSPPAPPTVGRRLAARHARSRRPHAGGVHRAGRRRRRVPHVRDSDPGRRGRATCARSNSIRATRASCITRTSASIARDRRVSSTRAIPSRATPAAWSATRAIRKGSCSAGRRARRRIRRPRARSGASSRAAISSSQLHLQPTGKTERVGVTVGFFFTDTAPTRTPVGLRLGSETIDIPAGDARLHRRRSLPAAGGRRGAGRPAARAQPRAADGGDGGAARRHDAAG